MSHASEFRVRRGSLTVKILAVNLVAPLVLMAGILYMSQYRDSLVRAELETLKAQAQLFAGAIAEGAVKPVERGRPFLFAKPEEIEVLIPEMARRMVRRLGESSDGRTQLFDERGRLIGDSHQLVGPGGIIQITPLDETDNGFSLPQLLRRFFRAAIDRLPNETSLRPFSPASSTDIRDYPDAALGLKSKVNGTPWRDEKGRIILTAAAPVRKVSDTLGVVLLTREGKDIEQAMTQARIDVFSVFVGALTITILLSMYLAGIIAGPLKKLARAAEQVKDGKGRQVEIPDFSGRRDEIGELSEALRGMTRALWDRMDTIERFAADVSHEIKNPLTSLRSAVETVAVVKTDKDRERLMQIIQHDVKRLDRLISDISNASRLDAELSRDEMGPVDLSPLLYQLADAHRMPLNRGMEPGEGESSIRLTLPSEEPITVRGNASRLAQVFDNLLTNALSFSPPDRPVEVTVIPERTTVRIRVEDHGPGIPESRLENIFERFYTERPKHEDYGSHSGLGLSIARQIIRSHGGKLWAENIHGEDGAVMGARFTVILDKA